MKLSDVFSMKRFIASGALFIVMALLMQNVVDRFWPASWWIEMRSVHVEDAVTGTAPRMREDRIIKRKFAGEYEAEVELKRRDKADKYTLFCKASGGPFDYSPDNEPPEYLDLAWWVGNACKEGGSSFTIIDVKLLPPGVYRVETCRTIRPLKFFSPRRVCVTSNDFTIKPHP